MIPATPRWYALKCRQADRVYPSRDQRPGVAINVQFSAPVKKGEVILKLDDAKQEAGGSVNATQKN
jgi:hypothetical protein